MKIYLDLLPEERKEKIIRNKSFSRIIRQEIMMTIPVAAFVFIIFFVIFCLNIKIASIENGVDPKNLSDSYKELKTYEKKFKEVNLKSQEISKIQNNHLNWSILFHKLGEITSEKIYFSDLTTDNYGVSLAGKAKTRDDLLIFQEKLKLENCFSDVNVPLSSLVSKEDLDFQLDFKIKEECLKNN